MERSIAAVIDCWFRVRLSDCALRHVQRVRFDCDRGEAVEPGRTFGSMTIWQ